MTKRAEPAITHLPFKAVAERIRRGKSPVDFPFDHLIADLKRQGFVVGVEHHLRLQGVLERFGKDSDPIALKTLLCPVFAATPEQQERFYKTFDRLFAVYRGDEKTAEPGEDRQTAKKLREAAEPPVVRKRFYVLLAILLIAFSGWLAQWLMEPPKIEEPKIEESKTTIREVSVPKPKPDEPVERKPNIEVEISFSVKPRQELTWYQRYGNGLIWMAALAPVILFLMNEWYRRRKRSLSLERGRGKKPPHVLSIDIQAPPNDFLMTRPFYTAANRMRQRLEGDALRLDVGETVISTIDRGGYPTLVYRPVTRPAEYLFLIDRGQPEDHYAAFMETAAGALEAEGVHLEVLFYDGDLQVVYRVNDPERGYLSDIAGRFIDHRLVIVGTAEGLLDPFSGAMEEWAEGFDAWPDRAVLTPVSPREWGMREVALARSFVVLPATVPGLEALVECFQSPVPPDLRGWVREDRGGSGPPQTADPESLKGYLEDETVFHWLCACAVYPEINWRLTLHLGIVMGALDEAALLRLIRLPWFREGYMPDSVRRRLIGELNNRQLKEVRESIFTVLEKNAPEKGSAAYDAHRLTLAVHRSLIAPERRERIEARREMKKAVEEMGHERVLRDMTLLKILEGAPASPLSLVLPRRFNRIFFRHGVPIFGLRSRIWGALVLMVSLLAVFGLPRPDVPKVPVEKELAMTFAHIPAGTFMMGSPADEPGRYDDETLHEVTLTKGFYMQTKEVTQGQWKAVMGENPSRFGNCGDDCPVEWVSWEDVQGFIKRLNEIEPKGNYRLPTEAEWEYACRAGSTDAFANGKIQETRCEVDPNLDKIGWYCGNAGSTNHIVATKDPNRWGLYDMHGNVWEWCQDWYGNYPKGPVTDPDGPPDGSDRVARGGSWNLSARSCRCAGRIRWSPDHYLDFLGFRLVRSLP